jgi:uncharacterized protein involved in exopolysaccharide biosynthesis
MNDMKDQEFIPRASLERAFKHWWIMVLLTVLGGLVGLAIHFLRPPVYEASAVLTVSMDFQKVKLTQREQDYAFTASGAIVNSAEVKGQVIAQARADGLVFDADRIPEQWFLERKMSVWEFHVRDQDPEIAARLANLWAEKALDGLNIDLEHALQADQIQDQITSITTQTASGLPVDNADAQATLQNLSDDLALEKQASQGVISIMKFALTDPAVIPQKPVLYDLAGLVLAGACIGFIVSLWVVNNNRVSNRG